MEVVGLWLLLRSMPHGAPLAADALADRLPDEYGNGRKAIQAAKRQLVQAGYLTQEREQQPNGKWRVVTTVFERPLTSGYQSVNPEGISAHSPAVGEPVSGGHSPATPNRSPVGGFNKAAAGGPFAREPDRRKPEHQVFVPDPTPRDDELNVRRISKLRQERTEDKDGVA